MVQWVYRRMVKIREPLRRRLRSLVQGLAAGGRAMNTNELIEQVQFPQEMNP
jgi:hypothetical protein